MARTRQAAVPAAETLVQKDVQESMASQTSRRARQALRHLREALEVSCVLDFASTAGANTHVDHAATRIVIKPLARSQPVVCEPGKDRNLESISRAQRRLLMTGSGAELSSKIS